MGKNYSTCSWEKGVSLPLPENTYFCFCFPPGRRYVGKTGGRCTCLQTRFLTVIPISLLTGQVSRTIVLTEAAGGDEKERQLAAAAISSSSGHVNNLPLGLLGDPNPNHVDYALPRKA